MIESEGYGADDVPDLLMTNFKPSDIVAHQYSMDSPEMGDILEAQDAALGQLVDALDANVEDYVVVVTADHGNTPAGGTHRCVAGASGPTAGGHRRPLRRSQGQVAGRADHGSRDRSWIARS